MKKVFSLFTVLAMVSNSTFAMTTTDIDSHSKMIAKTFNEFRYKMTVEVDPNDSKFQEKAVIDFKQKMSLLQDKGVSASEVMDYMRSTMLDDSSRKDFDVLINSFDSNQMSGEEAGNLAMKFMASKYQQGANYSGGQGSYKWVAIVIGVVIVGVVAYYVYKNNVRTSTQTNTETNTLTMTDTFTETVTNTDTNTNPCFGFNSNHCD